MLQEAEARVRTYQAMDAGASPFTSLPNVRSPGARRLPLQVGVQVRHPEADGPSNADAGQVPLGQVRRHQSAVSMLSFPRGGRGTSFALEPAQIHLLVPPPSLRARYWPDGLGSSALEMPVPPIPCPLAAGAPTLTCRLRTSANAQVAACSPPYHLGPSVGCSAGSSASLISSTMKSEGSTTLYPEFQ